MMTFIGTLVTLGLLSSLGNIHISRSVSGLPWLWNTRADRKAVLDLLVRQVRQGIYTPNDAVDRFYELVGAQWLSDSACFVTEIYNAGEDYIVRVRERGRP